MSIIENMEYLVRPRTVAMVGATEKNIGRATYENMQRLNYSGKVYFVHPKHEEILGHKTYKRLADIPDEVDCAVLVLRASLIPDAVTEMKEKGVKSAIIFASGFSEMGEEGRRLQEEVSRRLREAQIAACGANCLGLINLADNIPLYSAPIDAVNPKGPIGMVAHSGSACIGMSSANRGTGYAYLISCGNEAGLRVPEYYEFMMNEPSVKVMAGFLETVRYPEQMAKVGRMSVENSKPIVILYTGRSATGQKAAAAHSGALASGAAMVEAFYRKNHFLTVKSFDEQAEALELLSYLKDVELTSDKIGCTTISGGQLGFTCDVAEDIGLQFANVGEKTIDRLKKVLPDFATATNPLDVTTALFDPEAYKECVRAIADDPETGLVLICQDAESIMAEGEKALYNSIATAMVELQKELSKPIIFYSPVSDGFYPEFRAILKEGGVPLLQGAHPALNAVKLLIEWSNAKKAIRTEKTAEITAAPSRLLAEADKKALSERESKAVFAEYGLPVAADVLTSTVDDAVTAADKMGYPVVLKVDSPDIMHKTEAGIVALNIGSAEKLREAYARILSNAKAYNASAKIQGVSVQEMVPKGIEVLVGAKNDPKFGPSVMVGVGGIFVEIFKDVSLELAPVSKAKAVEMIENLKARKLFHGARGTAEADVEALADFVCKFSEMVVANSDHIAEVDVNPVIVLPKGQGVKAVDGLIVLK